MVEVTRDRHGVSHVFASSEEDALFGHGFVHAQDRLFQMEGARRLAAGRLSEIAGSSMLQSDRLIRRIGLHRAADRDVLQVDAAVGRLLDAYARGVNEGVRHLKALPPEFALIGDHFEPWSRRDVMLVGRLVMFGFAGNWNTELTRERLADALGVEVAQSFDPVHPSSSTVTGEEYAGAADRLLAAYRAVIDAGLPSSAGSNAWAVTSSRTGTGAPLLGSDPHVEAGLPGLFHVVHLSGGDLDVIGAGIPGIPGVAMGHNRSIAWGITAGMADVADCFIEEFDPERPRHYRTPDGWSEVEEVIERIDVLDSDPVDEVVLITRHGPVISPIVRGEERAIALRSTVVEGRDIATPFASLWRASTLDEAQRAVETWPGTTFNFVIASVEDRVGYRFCGQVPMRAEGEGLLPQRGATSPGPSDCWPADRLPRVVDPADGMVVSANNAPGSPLELGEEWAEPARADRIRLLIEKRERHDVASFAAIQTDRYSANLARLRDLILQRGVAPEEARRVLEDWHGYLEADSAGAALALTTFRQLLVDAAERRGGPRALTLMGQGLDGLAVTSAFGYRTQGPFIAAAEDAAPPWFADGQDRDRQLRGAAERACGVLRERCGSDPGAWRLGAVQRMALRHALYSVPGLGRAFSRGEQEFGGDSNTIVQGGAVPWHDVGRVTIAPGYRQILDLADWDRSVFMLPAGTSGIPGHPSYDDCIEEYLTGSYRPLLFSRTAVMSAAEHVLSLQPEAGSP